MTQVAPVNHDSENWSVRSRGLSKSYKIYGKPTDLLTEIFTKKTRHAVHHALQNVDFTIAKGEVVGIIGSNGAGKSTLLKIIAGTLSPTSGEIEARGKISAILELGTGFHPEYSGRENVFLGGMCLGMTREEVEKKFDWIVNFAELGDAIDQPFKTYSSGMAARLTFATAIAIEPEILIIDEALAAGDSYFVVKCGKRIKELCESGATVLFVSHSTYQVATLCQRAIWIDQGKVIEIGNAIDVCRHYDYSVHQRLSAGVGKVVNPHLAIEASDAEVRGLSQGAVETEPLVTAEISTQSRKPKPVGNGLEIEGFDVAHDDIYRKGPSRITAVRFLDENNKPVTHLRTWDTVKLEVEYVCPEFDKLDGTLGLSLAINKKSDLTSVAMFSTVNPIRDGDLANYDSAPFRVQAKDYGVLRATFPHFELLEGEYLFSLGIQLNIPSTSDFHEYHHMRYIFRVGRNGYPSGSVFHPNVVWSHAEL